MIECSINYLYLLLYSGYILRNNKTSKSSIRRSDHEKVKTKRNEDQSNRGDHRVRYSIPLPISRPKNVQSFVSELLSSKKISRPTSIKPLSKGDFDFEPFFPNYSRRKSSSTRPPFPQKPEFQMQVEGMVYIT